MRRVEMVVGVVVLICSSLCKCDLGNIGGLENLVSLEKMNSVKGALRGKSGTNLFSQLTGIVPHVGSSQLMSSSSLLPVDMVTKPNVALNELISTIPGQITDTISSKTPKEITGFITKQPAAGTSQTSSASCGLALPPEIIPQLPASVMDQLLPSLSLLSPNVVAQLPTSILSQMSPEVLETLPASKLSELPVSTLSQLSLPTLANLPANTLMKLPPSITSLLPDSALEKLPTDFLSTLPLSVLSGFSQPLLSRMVQDIIRQLPLPIPMLYQLSNLKQLATPDTITSLLAIIDIFKSINS